MTDGIIQFLIILVIVTVIGHGIWLLLAALFRWVSDKSTRELAWQTELCNELNSSCKYLSKLLRAKKISQAEYDSLRDIIDDDYKAINVGPPLRLKQDESSELQEQQISASEELIQAIVVDDQGGPTSEFVQAETSASPEEVTFLPDQAAMDDVDSSAAGVSAGTRQQDTSQPAPWDVPDEPAEPRVAIRELLQTFMQQRNIRWGEVISGILIVGSAVGLVISLRAQLEQTIPYFPAMLFMLITAAIHGAGLYTLKQWKLAQTSRGLLIIGMLLIPLSFLAACIISSGSKQAFEVTDPQYLVAVVIGLGCFTTMSVFSSKALTRRYWINMVIAVMGCSAGQLLINRIDVGPDPVFNNLLLLPAVAAFVIALLPPMTSGLSRLSGAKNRHAFLTLTGIGFFSLTIACGFLVSKSPTATATLSTIAPSLSLISAILIGVGVCVWSTALPTRSREQITGISIAASGAFFSVIVFVIAFPNPLMMLWVSLIVGFCCLLLAYRTDAVPLHAPAVTCLAISGLMGVHLLLGHYSDSEPLAGEHLKLLLSATSAITLFAFGAITFAASWLLARPGIAREALQPHANMIRASATVVAIVATPIALAAGFANPDSVFDVMTSTIILGIVVTGFACYTFSREENLWGYASALAIVGFFAHTLFWNQAIYDRFELLRDGSFSRTIGVFLSSSIVSVLIGLFARRFVRNERVGSSSIANRSREFSLSALALGGIAIFWILVSLRDGFKWPAIDMSLVAALFFAVARETRVKASLPQTRSSGTLNANVTFAFQAIATFAIGLIAAALTVDTGYFETWKNVNHLHLQICVAALACSVWIGLRQRGLQGSLVVQDEQRRIDLGFDELLLAALIAVCVSVSFISVLPGMVTQLGMVLRWQQLRDLSAFLNEGQAVGSISAIAVGLAILLSCWKGRVESHLAGLLVLGTVLPMKLSQLFPVEQSVSALRWSFSMHGFVIAGAMAMFAKQLYKVQGEQELAEQAEPTALPGDRFSIAGRQLTYTNLLLTILPVVVLTTTVAFVQVFNKSLVAPSPGSIFQWMGPEVHYAGPILFIVSMLLVYAVTFSVPRFAWWGSLVFQYFVGVAITILAISQLLEIAGRDKILDSEWIVSRLYALTMGMSGFGLVWLWFKQRIERDSTGATDQPLRWHQTMNMAMPFALSVWGMLSIVANPSSLFPWTKEIGTGLGVASLASVVILFVFVYRLKIYSSCSTFIAVAAITACGIGACFIDKSDLLRQWHAFHAVLIGLPVIAAVMTVMQSKLMRYMLPQVSLIGEEDRKETFWQILTLGGLALVLVIRGIWFDPTGPRYSLGVMLGLFGLANLLAVHRSRATMISVAGILLVGTNVLFWLTTKNSAFADIETLAFFSVSSVFVFTTCWLVVEFWFPMTGTATITTDGTSDEFTLAHRQYQAWAMGAHVGLLATMGYLWFVDFGMLIFSSRELPVDWQSYMPIGLAIGFTILAFWSGSYRFRKSSWFLIGCSLGVYLPIVFTDSPERLIAWTCAAFSGLYMLIGMLSLWKFGGLQIARSLKMPFATIERDRTYSAGETASGRSHWISHVGLMMALVVVLCATVVLIAGNEREMRHVVTFSLFGFAFGLGMLSRGKWNASTQDRCTFADHDRCRVDFVAGC